ncbi:MAG: uroporphyrinogen decarboxylase family protein [Burkholderiaceae bacterium]
MLERPFKTKPDFEHLRAVLLRERKDGPVPLLELAADPEIMSEVTGIPYPAARARELVFGGPGSLDPEAAKLGIALMDLSIAYSAKLGLDYATMIPLVPLSRTRAQLAKTGLGRERALRSWQDEHAGLITNRDEFLRYRWPAFDQINILPVEYAATRMPDGMKVVLMYRGIFEDLRQLMGFESMAYATADDPELVDDVLEGLTRVAEYTVGLAAAHPATGAIFYGDDMGFSSGTFLSPRFMRQHVIPRLKRIADACHEHGKPFLLHSCGNVLSLMEDFIDVVGIDAKHSFEDKILPVEDWYARYASRIAIIGGLDMDLLGRGSEEEVRARTRQILQACAPGGGYCMGTGNSAANYIKLDNYYAMIDETRKWNEEHGC